MTENEKKVREWISLYGRHGTQTGPLGRAFDALLAEHRAEVAAARDAALEEAGVLLDATRSLAVAAVDRAGGYGRSNDAFIGEMRHAADVLETQADRIRALKSQPARRFLDAERVREAVEVLSNEEPYTAYPAARKFGLMLLARLGLDLDATPAREEQRPLWRWSNQKPQHVHLGDEDRRPDDSEE